MNASRYLLQSRTRCFVAKDRLSSGKNLEFSSHNTTNSRYLPRYFSSAAVATTTATNNEGQSSNSKAWELLLASAFFMSVFPSTTTAYMDTTATTADPRASAAAAAAASIGDTVVSIGSAKFGGAASGSLVRGFVAEETSSCGSDDEGGGGGREDEGGSGAIISPLLPFHQLSFLYATAESMELDHDDGIEYPLACSSNVAARVYEVSAMGLQGMRGSMEDEYLLADEGRFAAVFDGHGGSAVSSYLKAHLYDTVCQYLEKRHWEDTEEHQGGGATPAPAPAKKSSNKSNNPSIASYAAAIRDAFKQIDDEVTKDESLSMVGSTAVVVLVHETDDGRRTLLSANIGDSRAVLSRGGKVVELTKDHKPNDEREKARIISMGETVEWEKASKVHRVRNLAVSRAVGDSFAKPTISNEVEIKHFPIKEEEDEFVVIASDGLWDVMTNREVITFVKRQMKRSLSRRDKTTSEVKKQMAGRLAREAFKRGSSDNISVVLLWLKNDDDDPENSA